MNGTRDTIIRASHDDAAAAKAEARRTLDLLFDPDQVIVMRDDGRPGFTCLHNSCKDYDWHTLREKFEPDSAGALSVSGAIANAHEARDPWSPPIPFATFDLPPFPTEAFSPWLRALVESEATATQTPVDLAAMLALATLATACQKKVEVLIRPGWREPVNLFVVVSMPPGSRKSVVFADMTAPLLEWEHAEAQRMRTIMAEGETERKIAEGRLRLAQDAAAKAPATEQAAAGTEALRLARALDAMTTPTVPRLIADDTTVEKLTSLVAAHGGRMAVLSAEGGIFDIMSGRYSAGGLPNFDVFLKAHAGICYGWIGTAGLMSLSSHRP